MAVNRSGKQNYTQKTLKFLRDLGCDVDKAEKFNAFAGPFGQREDLFGFIDIIALDDQRGIIAIQSTGPSGHAEHRKKILDCKFARKWLECGGIIELWSWRKLLVNRGGSARRWQPRIEQITEKDFSK